MSSFVCAISRTSPKNWCLCKDVGLFGLPTARMPRTEVGDRLFVWIGGRGYVAEGRVTGPPRRPTSRAEAPWPGGTYRFGLVVPFDLVIEVKGAVKFPFIGQKQDRTGVSKSQLQRSLGLISDGAGQVIGEALRALVETEHTRLATTE